MRHRFVVTYDIREPRRLRKVFRVMKGYGTHLQYSVFRCDLTAMMMVQLKSELRDIIQFDEDRILFVDVGPTEGRGEDVFETLGVEDEEPAGDFATIV